MMEYDNMLIVDIVLKHIQLTETFRQAKGRYDLFYQACWLLLQITSYHNTYQNPSEKQRRHWAYNSCLLYDSFRLHTVTIRNKNQSEKQGWHWACISYVLYRDPMHVITEVETRKIWVWVLIYECPIPFLLHDWIVQLQGKVKLSCVFLTLMSRRLIESQGGLSWLDCLLLWWSSNRSSLLHPRFEVSHLMMHLQRAMWGFQIENYLNYGVDLHFDCVHSDSVHSEHAIGGRNPSLWYWAHHVYVQSMFFDTLMRPYPASDASFLITIKHYVFINKMKWWTN